MKLKELERNNKYYYEVCGDLKDGNRSVKIMELLKYCYIVLILEYLWR